jgi:hypothetical protein
MCLRTNFPKSGISARAAEAIVISDEWTDADPMLNMSSFVTTYAEPEAFETARRNGFGGAFALLLLAVGCASNQPAAQSEPDMLIASGFQSRTPKR